MASVKYPLVTNFTSSYGTASVVLNRTSCGDYCLNITAQATGGESGSNNYVINDERDAVREYSQAIFKLKEALKVEGVGYSISH